MLRLMEFRIADTFTDSLAKLTQPPTFTKPGRCGWLGWRIQEPPGGPGADAPRPVDAECGVMTDWPREIYDVLKEADIRQVSYVPDAGHARLIEMCTDDNEIRSIPLATELEGIGIAAGNCINTGHYCVYGYHFIPVSRLR